MKNIDYVEDYFQSVIKNSWTWERLTEEEKQRFLHMTVFEKIKGRKEQRVEWMNTIYYAFLEGIGYKPFGWREPDDKWKELPKF